MPPDKFGTSFAHGSRKLDRFNLCSRVVLKLMGPVIGDHAAVDQLEIIKRHAVQEGKTDAKHGRKPFARNGPQPFSLYTFAHRIRLITRRTPL